MLYICTVTYLTFKENKEAVRFLKYFFNIICRNDEVCGFDFFVIVIGILHYYVFIESLDIV